MNEAQQFLGTDRFEVISQLGEGGMGAVYHVVDHQRSTRIALKTVGEGKGDALYRFKHEFRALQEIDHPNLVTLGELFEHRGQWFFTMELVAGVDLLSHVRPADRRSSAPPPDRAHADTELVGDTAVDAAPARGGLLAWRRRQRQLDAHPVAGPEAAFDEVRLRRALAQLCDGVHALHEQGHLHRDIKPDNVLVDENGRVVLIDFGLVVDMSGQDPLGQVVGTAAYMAPEQAAGQAAGPATDWYAVGVTLYEALTGRVPFRGPYLRVMLRKQHEIPPAPSALVSGIPADLDRLCMDLLQIAPDARPTGEAILRRLQVGEHGRAASSTRRSSSSQGGTFVGREEELAILVDAAERAARGQQTVVVVAGASGMGKSRLVGQLESELLATGDTLVLKGRCYEQESVPFKAFDGIMDQLSRLFREQAPEALDDVLPRHSGLLGRAFPVLRRVRAIDEGPLPDTPDPLEQRRLLFAAVRELFLKLRARQPLVLCIDDAQWSDEASRRLLEALVRRPAPACLFVLTERTAAIGAPSQVASWFDDAAAIEVGPLSPTESLTLAKAHLGRDAEGLTDVLDQLVDHAQGHPIFLETLVRHAELADDRSVTMDLDGVLLQQLERLDDDSRGLLEVVCLAGFPLDRALAATAADVEPGRLPQRLRSLRVTRMVRSSDGAREGALEPYHARIREAVLLVVDDAARRRHHRALARTLDEHGAAPEQIAQHYEGGGQPERATVHLLRAAHRAMEAFAFRQAARSFERALALDVMDPATRQATRVRLGDALANAGQGEEAAAAYEAALAEAGTVRRVDLQRRIAEQLLTAGLYRRGVAAGRDVMRSFDLDLPKTPSAAFRRLAWLRIRLGVRGLGYEEREPDELSPKQLARIDACWYLSRGFAAHDVILAQVLQSQALLHALEAGEPRRIAKGLCYEYLSRAIDGPASIDKHLGLVERARAIGEATDDPTIEASVAFAEGMGAHTAACHFTTSAPLLEKASRILRGRCNDVAWEQSLADEQRLLAYFWLGRFRDLARDCPELCAHAEDVGNKYWVNRFAGSYLSFVAEMRDDVAEAEKLVARGAAALPEGASAVQRFGQLWCATRLDLYRGRWEEALTRLGNFEADMLASIVLKVPLVAFTHHYDLARVFLAAALGDPARAKRHLRRARKAAKTLRKLKVPFAAAIADAVTGAAFLVAEERDQGLRALERAEAPLREHGLAAIATAVMRVRGLALGGEAGAALVAGADRWFVGEAVRNPMAMTRMLLPAPSFTEPNGSSRPAADG